MRNNLLLSIETILWACVEDYNGIWEMPWELSSTKIFSDEIVQAVSLIIMSKLLKYNFIGIYICKEPYGDMIEVDLSTFNIENLEDIWNVPDFDETGIRLSANKSGEDFYNKIIDLKDKMIIEDPIVNLFIYEVSIALKIKGIQMI